MLEYPQLEVNLPCSLSPYILEFYVLEFSTGQALWTISLITKFILVPFLVSKQYWKHVWSNFRVNCSSQYKAPIWSISFPKHH